MIHEELDRELELRLRVTLDEMIPKLVASAPSIDRSPSGSTSGVEVVVGRASRPKRSSSRSIAVVVAAAAAIAGLAIIINQRVPDDAASSESPTASTGTPDWYSLLRPLVPERFEFLAITNSTEDSAAFVAISAGDGKALEIMVAPTGQYSDTAGTADQVGLSMAKLMSSVVANGCPRWWPTKVLAVMPPCGWCGG